MARERGAHATGDGASTVIASDSEATQTEPQLETPSLGRVALLAMTETRSQFSSGGTRSSADSRKLSGRERKCERGYSHCRLRHGRRDAGGGTCADGRSHSHPRARRTIAGYLGNAGCSRDLSARRVPPRRDLDRRRRRGLQSRELLLRRRQLEVLWRRTIPLSRAGFSPHRSRRGNDPGLAVRL